MKKNVYPHAQNEWKRLKEAENVEKNKPENVGRVYRFDPHTKILYRNSSEINRWNPAPF